MEFYMFLFYLTIAQCDHSKLVHTNKKSLLDVKTNLTLPKSSSLNYSTIVTANLSNISSSTVSYYDENSGITTADNEITYELYENATEVGSEITTTNPETTVNYENVTISLLSNGDVVTTSATPKISKKRGSGLGPGLQQNSDCSCDLTYASCDILCCCDADCPSDANKIFPYCLNREEKKRNLRYCDSDRNDNINQQSAFLAAEISELFCVMKDNLPEKTTTVTVDVTSLHNVKKMSEEYHTWKNNYIIVTNTTHEPKLTYGYGDPIWMMLNNSILAIGMPVAFLTEYCSERLPLTFLENKKRSCLTRLTDLEMFDANTNIQKMCVMTTPALLNKSCIANEQNGSTCGCVPIEKILCDVGKCVKVQNSELLSSPTCNDTFCLNMATSIKFIFYTNSTNIIEGRLYVHLSNISSSFKYVRQNFESVYFYRTHNVTYPRELSGNPGYIVGKPIIVSNVIQNNTVFKFDYYLENNSFPLRNILPYPKNVAGNCVLSNVTFIPINFGENIQSFCKYSQHVELNDNFNAAIFCADLQKQIRNFLQQSSIEKQVVSKYGNPYMETNDNWIPFVSDGQSYDVGGESRDANIVICKNFVRSISYEFLFSRIENGTGKREAMVMSAFVKENAEDIEFKINSNIVSTIISVSSMFYDVTKATNYEYAAEHKFYLHIPYDFFYPFTMNAGKAMHCRVFVYVFLLLIHSVILIK